MTPEVYKQAGLERDSNLNRVEISETDCKHIREHPDGNSMLQVLQKLKLSEAARLARLCKGVWKWLDFNVSATLTEATPPEKASFSTVLTARPNGLNLRGWAEMVTKQQWHRYLGWCANNL